MIINELLRKEKMSRYRLSKESGVPMTTITDICTGKTDIEKCASGTLFKIAGTLGITVDAILEDSYKDRTDYRCSFETFKSNTCHRVKDIGDLDFIIETLEKDEIKKLYDKQWYRESLYLLGMVDYLSRVNNIPLCTEYSDIRDQKLETPLYPVGVVLNSAVNSDETILNRAMDNAIPEFKRFNIIENEVRNVY